MSRWANNECPATPAERKLLHELLVDYARNAALGIDPKGLKALVDSIRNDDVRWQVIGWLNRYSPIRRHVHGDGRRVQYVVKKDPSFDLGPARLNPFYGERSLIEGRASQSERELERKRLKAALEKFMKDPCKESMSEMHSLMETYIDASRQGKRNGMFVSGGLPSPGKGR